MFHPVIGNSCARSISTVVINFRVQTGVCAPGNTNSPRTPCTRTRLGIHFALNRGGARRRRRGVRANEMAVRKDKCVSVRLIRGNKMKLKIMAFLKRPKAFCYNNVCAQCMYTTTRVHCACTAAHLVRIIHVKKRTCANRTNKERPDLPEQLQSVHLDENVRPTRVCV